MNLLLITLLTLTSLSVFSNDCIEQASKDYATFYSSPSELGFVQELKESKLMRKDFYELFNSNYTYGKEYRKSFSKKLNLYVRRESRELQAIIEVKEWGYTDNISEILISEYIVVRNYNSDCSLKI